MRRLGRSITIEQHLRLDWRAMLRSKMQPATRRERIADERQTALELNKRKFDSQHDKLVEWCRLTKKDAQWAEMPRQSAEYQQGFERVKKDLQRKSR